MAEVREMTIPLRAAWSVPRTRRANRAMAQIRKHVSQHMKKTDEEEIWIDESVNHVIWSRGMQNPPRKIRVQVTSCLLYTSPSPRDQRGSRMPSSA